MHSVRVGDPLEGNASSNLRENRLELLGSVCWSLCPPSLAPPQTLTLPHVSLSPLTLLLSVSLHVSVHFFLCLSLSVSSALLPSPPPNAPFSWREVHCFSFVRIMPPCHQHWVFCTS